MELKELLGEELFNTIAPKLGDNKVIVNNGDWIPKSRFDEVNTEKNNLKSLVDNSTKELETLKANVKGNDELTKQIAELQANREKDVKELETKLAKTMKQSKVKESLMLNGVKSETALKALSGLIDIDKIEIENDKIKDFDSIIKPFKEDVSFASMFSSVVVPGVDSGKAGDSSNQYFSMDEIKKMTTEQVRANYDKVTKSVEYHNKK